MDEMVSFNPKDVIFLLNKWDTIAHVNEKKRKEYFEKTKKDIRTSWKETDDSYIFQISAVKVSKRKLHVLIKNKSVKNKLAKILTIF